MAGAGRRDAILRRAVLAHGGQVVKSTGDGLHAAFTRAPDAIGAALAAQDALRAEDWALPWPLQARMGLHTGMYENRDGNYHGLAVNRAARLMAVAHAGQVLLSQATAELVGTNCPPVRPSETWGQYHLGDLHERGRVFHLVAPDLSIEFRPLRTLGGRPNNLPFQLTGLIGREQEVAAASKQLLRTDVLLLTLTGPGGVGKTRLALQIAADTLDEFADGVFLVQLAPKREPTLVATTIARALGVRESADESSLESLKRFLRERALLVALNNFEHLLVAAPVVGELLGACPRLKAPVTSRVTLRLCGEHGFPVPPLALPTGCGQSEPEELAEYAAVGLFLERARAVDPAFALTRENALAVSEACRRLDGLPWQSSWRPPAHGHFRRPRCWRGWSGGSRS